MVLDISTAMGAMTGERYIASLKDGREVWLDGERVADVTTHAAFAGMVSKLARIYDLQYSPQNQDLMTFISPETGNRCSISWQLPLSKKDLRRKRRNSEIWNRQSWGQLGRSPDILAPFIITLYNMKDALSSIKNPELRFRRKRGQLPPLLHGKRPVPDPCAWRPPSGQEATATPWAGCTTNRTPCCFSSMFWYRGTAFSCSTTPRPCWRESRVASTFRDGVISVAFMSGCV